GLAWWRATILPYIAYDQTSWDSCGGATTAPTSSADEHARTTLRVRNARRRWTANAAANAATATTSKTSCTPATETEPSGSATPVVAIEMARAAMPATRRVREHSRAPAGAVTGPAPSRPGGG